MIPRPANPLVVALDTSDLDGAGALAASLAAHVALFKVGLELFTAHGAAAVERTRAYAPVFLDVKLHDIPTTVERAARNCARLRIAMLTVHGVGGEAMIRAAVRGVRQGSEDAGVEPPLVAAVTVLSSLSEGAIASAASLAFEGRAAGAGAAVVSGGDVPVVREAMGEEFALVVPGIRPAGSNGDDQVRVLTPRGAIEAGADYLVIGRPVTRASDPVAVARSITSTLR